MEDRGVMFVSPVQMLDCTWAKACGEGTNAEHRYVSLGISWELMRSVVSLIERVRSGSEAKKEETVEINRSERCECWDWEEEKKKTPRYRITSCGPPSCT